MDSGRKNVFVAITVFLLGVTAVFWILHRLVETLLGGI